MKQQTVHLGGTRATYCGWYYDDDRRPRGVTSYQSIPDEGPLPPLPSWQRWCRSCLRVRKAAR